MISLPEDFNVSLLMNSFFEIALPIIAVAVIFCTGKLILRMLGVYSNDNT